MERERNIIYGMGRPHVESNFEVFLNFVLRLLHKAVKGVASFAQRIFQPVKEKKHTYSEDL